ncbi:hypothetical protein ACNQFN_10965 [Thauera butanivorans]|uniref:hypothetical protein n=1 Tax=Thauera butanivorans TaxID=86174 RepID=UPI003AB2E5C4
MKQTLIDVARQLASAELAAQPPEILERMRAALGGAGWLVVEVVPDAGCPQIRVLLAGPGGDRYELSRILPAEARQALNS